MAGSGSRCPTRWQRGSSPIPATSLTGWPALVSPKEIPILSSSNKKRLPALQLEVGVGQAFLHIRCSVDKSATSVQAHPDPPQAGPPAAFTRC